MISIVVLKKLGMLISKPNLSWICTRLLWFDETLDHSFLQQCKEGQDMHPEQIKALLSDLATFHGSPIVGNCDM